MNRNGMERWITLVAFCLIFSLAGAQNPQITTQSLYWLKGNLDMKITDKWTIGTELEERRFMNPGAQHQILGTVSTTYSPGGKPWKVGAAFCAFFQSPNEPESPHDLIRPEWRPFQFFRISQGNKWVKFNQRVQLEERWMHNFSGNELTEGYFFILRFRYLMALDVALWRPNDVTKLKMYLGLEPHLQAGKTVSEQVFDQLRTTAGVVYSPISAVNLSLGYMHWYQHLGGDSFVSRHILTAGIAYTLDLRKGRQE